VFSGQILALIGLTVAAYALYVEYARPRTTSPPRHSGRQAGNQLPHVRRLQLKSNLNYKPACETVGAHPIPSCYDRRSKSSAELGFVLDSFQERLRAHPIPLVQHSLRVTGKRRMTA
jgi:hypothetical protein